MLAPQMAEAAMQRQPCDSGGRDDAAGHREAEELRLAVAVTPGGAALRTNRLRRRVDGDAPHLREVYHDPVVVDGVAGDVVPSRFDRECEPLLACEVDCVHDIGGTAALND